MTLEQLQQFFMYGTIINLVFMFVSFFAVISLRKFIYSFHGKLFALSEESINKALYNYLAIYKIITITFFLVPWISTYLMNN